MTELNSVTVAGFPRKFSQCLKRRSSDDSSMARSVCEGSAERRRQSNNEAPVAETQQQDLKHEEPQADGSSRLLSCVCWLKGKD